MKKNLANHLVRTIQDELPDSPQFTILESKPAKPLSGFHSFADGRPCLGAFLVGNGSAYKLWVLIIDWRNDENYYVVIYPENHNLPPVAELHNQLNEEESPDLSWSYKPSKHDGRNLERKEAFLRAVGSLEFVVSTPSATVTLDEFLIDLFTLAYHRVAADNLVATVPGHNREGFPEGRRIERLHSYRERDSAIVQLAKEEYSRLHKGNFPCEVCGFDFAKFYGTLGATYIEAHHIKPLSDLGEHKTQETKVKDLAMVCANCHRMLHRKRPWASIQQIKEFVSSET